MWASTIRSCLAGAGGLTILLGIVVQSWAGDVVLSLSAIPQVKMKYSLTSDQPSQTGPMPTTLPSSPEAVAAARTSGAYWQSGYGAQQKNPLGFYGGAARVEWYSARNPWMGGGLEMGYQRTDYVPGNPRPIGVCPTLPMLNCTTGVTPGVSPQWGQATSCLAGVYCTNVDIQRIETTFAWVGVVGMARSFLLQDWLGRRLQVYGGTGLLFTQSEVRATTRTYASLQTNGTNVVGSPAWTTTTVTAHDVRIPIILGSRVFLTPSLSLQSEWRTYLLAVHPDAQFNLGMTVSGVPTAKQTLSVSSPAASSMLTGGLSYQW